MISGLLTLGLLASVSGALAQDRPFTRTEDVIYGHAFGTALTLDVLRPEQPNGLGVIYVVSGGWFSAHEFINPKVVQPMLNRGYTVFAVVHGSNPRFHIPGIFEQMERSVRFIRYHAAEYGIDPGRMGVAGGSAALPPPSSALPTTPSALRFEDVLKIDAHVHVFDDLPEFADMLRRTQTRVVNICVGGNKPELLAPAEKRAEELREKYQPEFQFASTFDLTRRNEPGYVRGVTNWLNETFRGGAVMVKIWKDVGMELETPAGAYLMPDAPVFEPVVAFIQDQRRPLMAHFADPIDAWRPLDPSSAHHAYYANNPEWHVYGRKEFPSHAEILDARDRVLARHPNLVMIAAHLGSEAHDLDALAQRFDRFPNLHADVAARTPELQRQPAGKVRRFFLRYQDRLLYGTDADKFSGGPMPAIEDRVAFATRMEKWYRDEFEYYAGEGKRRFGGREVECLGLPRTVLEKFYHRNAQRLMPDLTPAAASPAPGTTH